MVFSGKAVGPMAFFTVRTRLLLSVFTLVLIAGEVFGGLFDARVGARVVDPTLAGLGVSCVLT